MFCLASGSLNCETRISTPGQRLASASLILERERANSATSCLISGFSTNAVCLSNSRSGTCSLSLSCAFNSHELGRRPAANRFSEMAACCTCKRAVCSRWRALIISASDLINS